MALRDSVPGMMRPAACQHGGLQSETALCLLSACLFLITVIFGPAAEGGQLRYGEVRKLPESENFVALHRRLESFYFAQVEELAQSKDGKCKVYAPFPLFLLTCVGIETLGKVFFGREPKEGLTAEDIQRDGFLRVCKLLHKDLPRPLSKEQKEAYDQMWGEGAHKHANTPANIIYRHGRHTLVHGYRGKGVYITGEIVELAMDGGALVLNPYWFWRAFRDIYGVLWKEFYANKEDNNPFKLSVLLYLAELLGSLALVYTSHEYRGTPAGWQRSKRLKGLSVHGRRRGG